jgi:membrane protein implicated in regulation of membrane protease activity
MSLIVAILLALFVLPSPWGVVAICVAAVWEVGEGYLMLRWTQRRRAQVGAEALIGRTARVVVAEPLQVAVKGERWRAHASQPVAVGDKVKVNAVAGLTLVVTAEAADMAAADD